MANEKIHEYLDVATIQDIAENPLVIDCDVEESGTWTSKQLNVRTLFEAYNSEPKIAGSFHDEGNQIHTSPNEPKAMNISNSDYSNGVDIANDVFGNPTNIVVETDGLFNIQFSAQLYRTSGGSDEQVSIWFRKNGVDIPNSNTHINVVANSRYSVASWNLFVDCIESDYIEIMWSVTSISITIPSNPEDLIIPHPATPSLIVTIAKI
jgi:hypothetical protein